MHLNSRTKRKKTTFPFSSWQNLRRRQQLPLMTQSHEVLAFDRRLTVSFEVVF